jgi:hypothetical protein
MPACACQITPAINAGLRSSSAEVFQQAPKPAKPKKRGRRPLDEDDVILAADVISSDDEFDDGANTYAYSGPSVTAGGMRPSVSAAEPSATTPGGSEAGEESKGVSTPSESEEDDDDDDDFDEDDFVG